MINKQFYIFLLSIILFTTSCNNVNTIKNIKTIDSLENILDTITKIQQNINFIDIALYYDSLKTDMDSIAKYVKYIPTNKHHKKYFSLYSNLRRDFNDFLKINIAQELKYTKTQLSNLKKDIKKNIISNELFNKYIYDEKTAVLLLKKQNNKQYSHSLKILNNYIEYKPVIIEIIDSCKTIYKNN